MHTCYSKSYLKEVQTFEPRIRRQKCSPNQQTVSQTAQMSQLPCMQQNNSQGCLP